jgi:hypothetical protein
VHSLYSHQRGPGSDAQFQSNFFLEILIFLELGNILGAFWFFNPKKTFVQVGIVCEA